MLKIICGQNTIEAYKSFLDEKKQLRKLGFEIIEIDPQKFEEIISWKKDNLLLFSQKKAFFTRNLNKKINKKNERQKKIIEKIIKDESFILIDFEEGLEKRDLKITDKKTEIKEFKLPLSIFNLLDNLYPKNLNSFIKNFNLLTKEIDEELIFYMIIKRVRQLLQIKFDQKIENVQSWQLKRLIFQAKIWSQEKLIKLYQSLFTIEKNMKTGNTPFDLKKSLELLFIYLLS